MTRTADNRDGTYTNPVIFADYPDPAIIRVGEDFYLASSSFTDAPGIPICHSRDLVNWKVIGHVYDRLPESNPAYSMTDGKTAYRGGSWAPSIRWHRGLFYVAYCTPAEGFFLARSARPEGPYEIAWLGGVELYDPGLFFEDDGSIFVVHGSIDIFLTELTPDGRAVASGPQYLYSTPCGFPFEGSHVHKMRGWYYIFNAGRGYNGIQTASRSRQLAGPYESRVITADDLNYHGAGLHQGGLIDLPNGDLWFCLFQDRDYVGRVPILFPARWQDDWPEIGDPANSGKIPVTVQKPAIAGAPGEPCATEGSDDFDRPVLDPKWHWNHNPDDTRWSLTARPGWLRLRAGNAPDLLHARNTLTQKITGGGCTATVQMDAAGMLAGDVAGLCVFGMPYAFIAVEQSSEGRRLIMTNDGRRVVETLILGEELFWLKAEADANGLARFAYSLDGGGYTPLGDELVMQFTVKTFMGNKFGLFCFNTVNGAAYGHADFDNMHYTCARQGANHYRATETIPGAAYDTERGAHPWRLVEKKPGQFLASLNAGDWVIFNHIDFGSGATEFHAKVDSTGEAPRIEVRLDGPDGELLGERELPSRKGSHVLPPRWESISCPITRVAGVRRICLRFTGGTYHLWLLDFTFTE